MLQLRGRVDLDRAISTFRLNPSAKDKLAAGGVRTLRDLEGMKPIELSKGQKNTLIIFLQSIILLFA
jgi:hypothetical protein